MKKIDRDLSDRFLAVFNQKLWGDIESISGPGSRSDNPMVIEALAALKHTIETYGIKSIADIPCGDFKWINVIPAKFPGIKYAGYDIVAPLIDLNRATFPGVRFEQLDIVSDVPPRADLIFTKELLIHLTDRDIISALANMKRSGATYLMASNSFGVKNEDLAMASLGNARPVDLGGAPFNLPPPLWRNAVYGLWRFEDVPTITLKRGSAGNPRTAFLYRLFRRAWGASE